MLSALWMSFAPSNLWASWMRMRVVKTTPVHREQVISLPHPEVANPCAQKRLEVQIVRKFFYIVDNEISTPELVNMLKVCCLPANHHMYLKGAPFIAPIRKEITIKMALPAPETMADVSALEIRHKVIRRSCRNPAGISPQYFKHNRSRDPESLRKE